MPGNLSAAVPTTVLPNSLSTAFTLNSIYPMLTTSYNDGTVERSIIQDGVNPPRRLRTWMLSKRLTTTQLSTLLSFFEARLGGTQPFYFYDPFEVIPGAAVGSNYDGSGASSQGRATVVFRSKSWSHTTVLGRHDVNGLELVEVA